MFPLALFVACTTAQTPDPPGDSIDTAAMPAPPAGQPDLVLRGGSIWPSGVTEIAVKDGVFVAMPQDLHGDVPVVDTTGQWLVPALIDSHVHVAYYPVGAELARNGIAAAVDLAAPDSIFRRNVGDLRLVASGPMVTAQGGYPTQSWGAGGYGLETADTASAARASVDALHAKGAGVIKLPVTGGNQLGADALAAAADQAHTRGLKVATHALTDEQAALAASAGADLLAHTPTAPLTDATLTQWGDRAVVGTLVAFGNGAATRSNLAALKSRGATVLYGTDFGNTRTIGVDGAELAAMVQAGLTPTEVLTSATSDPASYWGLDDLGAIEPGKTASFLVLDADPLVDVQRLASPARVYIAGAEQNR